MLAAGARLLAIMGVCVLAVAQSQTGFIEGLKQREAKEALDRILELERERIAKEYEIEKERLEPERQQLRPKEMSSSGPTPEQVTADIDKAVAAVRQKYPDLSEYLPEMQRQALLFRPASAAAGAIEKYIEGLFVIAKYASFSSKARSLPEGQFLTNDAIFAMVRAGFESDTILVKIKSSKAVYKLDTNDLMELKEASVPESVIRAMIQAASARASQ